MDNLMGIAAMDREILHDAIVKCFREAAEKAVTLLGTRKLVAVEQATGIGGHPETALALALRAAGYQKLGLIGHRTVLEERARRTDAEGLTPLQARRSDLARFDAIIVGDIYPEQLRHIWHDLSKFHGKIIVYGCGLKPDVKLSKDAMTSVKPDGFTTVLKPDDAVPYWRPRP